MVAIVQIHTEVRNRERLGLDKSCSSLQGTSKTESWVLGPLLPMMIEPALPFFLGRLWLCVLPLLGYWWVLFTLLVFLPIFSLVSLPCLVSTGVLLYVRCVRWHQFLSQPCKKLVGPSVAMFWLPVLRNLPPGPDTKRCFFDFDILVLTLPLTGEAWESFFLKKS